MRKREIDYPAEVDGMIIKAFADYEIAMITSVDRFIPGGIKPEDSASQLLDEHELMMPLFGDAAGFPAPASGEGLLVFARNPSPKGTMTVFGYDYLTDHLAAKNLPRPKLLDYQGLWGSGEEYAYETLNFADGKRNGESICEAVSAEYGPVPLDLVLEYLKALEAIGVLKSVPNHGNGTPSKK